MLEGFTNDADTKLGDTTECGSRPPAQSFYVDVALRDLVCIVVQLLGRDALSPSQVTLVLDAAADSALRQESGSTATRH